MSESKIIMRGVSAPKEPEPVQASVAAGLDKESIPSLWKLGKVSPTGDGLVVGVPQSPVVRVQMVSVAAENGVEFVCCGKRQSTAVYTTRMVCSVCSSVWQLGMKRVGMVKDTKPTKLQFLVGDLVELTEDHTEQMTNLSILFKKGTVFEVSNDMGLLPMDRNQEVAVKYKPKQDEWKTGGEPLELLFPIPFNKLRRVKIAGNNGGNVAAKEAK